MGKCHYLDPATVLLFMMTSCSLWEVYRALFSLEMIYMCCTPLAISARRGVTREKNTKKPTTMLQGK